MSTFMTCKFYELIFWTAHFQQLWAHGIVSSQFIKVSNYFVMPQMLTKIMQTSTPQCSLYSWLRHQMETLPRAENSPVIGEFPSQRPVTRSFDVFFDLRLNKRLSKQLIYIYLFSNGNMWQIQIQITEWVEVTIANNLTFTSHQLSLNGLWYNYKTEDRKPLWYIFMCEILIACDSATVMKHRYLTQWCTTKCNWIFMCIYKHWLYISK